MNLGDSNNQEPPIRFGGSSLFFSSEILLFLFLLLLLFCSVSSSSLKYRDLKFSKRKRSTSASVAASLILLLLLLTALEDDMFLPLSKEKDGVLGCLQPESILVNRI